jgi:predicted transglutaminase-like cysteine proteinase
MEGTTMLMKAEHDLAMGNELPELEMSDADNRTRLLIWEINHCFKCPIIGMCITLDEQKRLLKKLGLLRKNESAFEMHETMVAAMDQENKLSRRIDNLLERKYGKKAAVLLKLDDDAFLAAFKEAMETGEAGAVLWATAVSLDLSTTCRRAVFGDIHMTMHWNGEQLLQFKRKLSRQKMDLARMQSRLETSVQQRRQLKKEANGHKREIKTLQNALAAEKKENLALQQATENRVEAPGIRAELEQDNRELCQTMDTLRQYLAEAKQEIYSLKEENQQLASKLEQQHDVNAHVREETRNIIAAMTSVNRCDESCPSFDLCKKRILIVGGVTRMEALYRDLIESSNGVFDYHDGYVRKGAKDLESCLKRADMVLCPVNCNSHAACSIVKNLGKKHNKSVHILANASLSAVSQVIWGGSGEACRLN